MTKTLHDYIRKNSKFIKIKSGEVFTGIYRGYGYQADTFNPEKETVAYKFSFVDEPERNVFWVNGSNAVARLMADIALGTTVEITRNGSGMKDTKYEVKLI